MNFQLSILNGTVLKNLSFVNCFLLLLLFSHVWLFSTSWTAAVQASQSFTISQSLLKLMSLGVSDVIQPSHSLLSLFLRPSIFPSFRVFSSETALCNRSPKYWSFRINPSNEYSGLISFRIDWLDLLAVQGFGCWQLLFWYVPAEKGSSISIQCIWKNEGNPMGKLVFSTFRLVMVFF